MRHRQLIHTQIYCQRVGATPRGCPVWVFTPHHQGRHRGLALLVNGCLHLLEPVKTGTINLPIDFFFRSLSEDRGEKAIGIILSGTASDDTIGVRTI